jgi:branched-chain amino acid transport system substrate-binding protein
MKTRNTLTGVILVISILVLGATWSLGTLQAAEKQPIKIGLVHTMSGAAAMYGQAAKSGGLMAIDEINHAGGVLGRPLELIVRDDTLNPEVGAREAKDLVLSQKVDFLTGCVITSIAMSVSAYAKEAKKIFIVQASVAPTITEETGHRYVFRFAANATNLVGAGAKACAKIWGDKKVITIDPDYEYGHAMNGVFWEFYPKYVPGATSIDALWPPLETKDYTPYISKIMSSDAELVVTSLFGGYDLTFIKQAYPLGFFDKFHYFCQADGDTEVMVSIKPGQPFPKGGLAVARYPYWEPITPKSLEFAKKFQSRFGTIPSYGSLNEYMIIYALKQAIEKVGSVDTEKIIDAMEGMVFSTLLGPIEMRACDHQAMMPCWVGITDVTSDVPYPHVTQLQKFDNPYTIYHSCEEIMKARKQ